METIVTSAPEASQKFLGLNSDDWYRWLRADESLLLSIASCQEGGWGFFFFSSALCLNRLPMVSPLPTEPEGLTKLLKNLGAEAGVVSEIDDIYWLVGFST